MNKIVDKLDQPKVSLIAFNEANMELIEKYLSDNAHKNKWPAIRKYVSLSKAKTSSEKEYDLLEPWIQWTSIHTGLNARDHNIFRLGDINTSYHRQIFESIEQNGHSVGCISAMNAENRLENPSYFIPDPWTVTKTDGSSTSDAIYTALHQAVNDNATGKLTNRTIAKLLYGLLTASQKKNWKTYIKLFTQVLRRKKWHKALFLDLFLSDLHLSYYRKTRPDFTTLFLNGFAHLQHHYFFSSKFYDGKQNNPAWYIDVGTDPFTSALDVYDRIFAQHFEQMQDREIIIATGLQQVPYDNIKFYYRLKNHQKFLELLGEKVSVFPRMTRDFLIECSDKNHAVSVENKLKNIRLCEQRVFGQIDNRGQSLFVTLTYPHEIKDTDRINLPDGGDVLFKDLVVFVAIKNGMHHQIGYVSSTKPNTNLKDLDGAHVRNLHNYILNRYQH